MYTRCPECDTVFRIERKDLDAAGGEVRCGRCSGIFDARAGLTEEPPETEGRQHATGGSPTGKIGSGDRREQRPEEDEAPDAGDATGSEADEDAMLEFSLPDDRWNEVFIEGELSAEPEDRSTSHDSAFGAESVVDDEVTMPRDEPPEEPPTNTSAVEPIAFEEESDIGILVEESDDSEIELYFGSTFPGVLRETEEAQPHAADIAPAERPTRDEQPDDGLSFYREPTRKAKAPARSTRRAHWLWGIASVVLLAGVVIQLVHMNRNDWVALPWAGDVIEGAYRMAGVTLDPQWNVDEYRVVASAAAAESQQPGTLRIHATLANMAERAQPYPLIHVTLTDRWGDGISERVLEPREYAGEGVETGRLLEPGEPVQADIAVVDPGEDAFGFELDVCLRDAQRRVRCSDRE
ncbi:MAG: DUF3426 domain-containing protein [Gammaproteobacteria bacterium]